MTFSTLLKNNSISRLWLNLDVLRIRLCLKIIVKEAHFQGKMLIQGFIRHLYQS